MIDKVGNITAVRASAGVFLLIACIIVSTYAAKNLIRFAPLIIGMASGRFLSSLILFGAKITKYEISLVVYLVLVFFMGLFGHIFKRKMNVVGTSIIGAFLVVYGIAILIGNWPSQNEIYSGSASNKVVLGYSGAIIYLAIFGIIL